MSGPLAQQFAVQDRVDSLIERAPQLSEEKFAIDALQLLFDVSAALSVIERHVQDMEKALVELLVVAQTDDPWLIGGKRYRELLENARAALPAREKGEE